MKGNSGTKPNLSILHINATIGGGGRERRMGQLAIELHARPGFDQRICYFKRPARPYAEIEQSGVALKCLDIDRRRFGALSLFSELRRVRPDIVHVWAYDAISILIILILKPVLGYKLIIGDVADGNPIAQRRYRILAGMAFRRADAIVSNSRAGLLAKGAPTEKSHVIYNGFDFSRLDGCGDADERSRVKANLGVTTRHMIPMVARVSAAKDFDMFVDVARRINTERSDVTFVAVGSGNRLEEFRRLTVDDPRIIFVGQCSNVEKILDASTLSLLFTNERVHAEGVSNSIMESMAAGRPVVATRGGGTPEIITDGVDGIIIEPADCDAAVQAINRLLDDSNLCTSMGTKAAETIRRRFNTADRTDEYIKLYNSIMP